VCVFHSLSGKVIFGGGKLLDLLLSFPGAKDGPGDASAIYTATSDIALDLKAKGLLVADESGDEALLNDLGRRHQEELDLPIWQMYLLTTVRCNLACSYCYIDASYRLPEMTLEIAEQAVRYFNRHSQGESKPRIVFYGGEPLLNKRAVFAAASEARRLESSRVSGGRFNLLLITNGYSLDRAVAEGLKRLDINVSVSIDGPRFIHNGYRRTRGGQPSFVRVTRAVELLRDIGIEPAASVTITPKALKQWDEVTEFLSDTLQFKRIDFNVLLPGPMQSNEYDAEDIHIGAALLRAHECFRRKGIHEDRVMRRVRAFTKRKFRFTDCPGVGQQIAVAPDGTVGPCQGLQGSKQYFPLDVERDFDRSPTDHPLFGEWANRTTLNIPKCRACPAIAVCGGGCPLAAIRDGGSMWEVDRRVCEYVKAIHEWLIWELHDKNLAIDA
jgi:uncharacterized protein